MTTDTITLELNLEEIQRELNTYRNIGSIPYFRHLNRQEMRRRKRLNCIKKVLHYLFNIVVGAFITFDIWVFLSWIDVVLHNSDPNPVYQFWNIFTLF